MDFFKQAVGGADQFWFAIGGVRTFSSLFTVSSVLKPHVGMSKQAAVVGSPCAVGRPAALAAAERCSTSDKPGTVFAIHTALGPFCGPMRVASSPAVRDSVAKRRTIAAVHIARLCQSGLTGASRIAADAGTASS